MSGGGSGGESSDRRDPSIVSKLRSIFAQGDHDGSGSINIKEMGNILAQVDIHLDDFNKKMLLKKFDRVENGKLDCDEFINMMYYVLEIKQAFEMADRDNSSLISTQELSSIFSTIGVPLPRALLMDTLHLFDEDKSKEINFQEFFAMITYYHELQYQYDQFIECKKRSHPKANDDDDEWLSQLVNERKPAHLRAIAKRLERVGDDITFETFAHIIIEEALSIRKSGLLGFFGLKKGPKIFVAEFKPRVKSPLHRNIAPSHKDTHAKLNQWLIQSLSIQDGPSSSSSPSTSSSSSMEPTTTTTTTTITTTTSPIFVDSAFPPESAVTSKKDREVIAAWRRPCEIHPDGAQVFVGGVNEADVVQGYLGDCWLLSALAVVATSGGNAFVENMFVQSDMGTGQHKIKFYKNGKWVVVDIDDRIAVNKNGKPLYATCKEPSEFWVSLVEKAYAKLHGSFDAIESGAIAHALKDLTGESVESIFIDKKNPATYNDALFDKLEHYIQESFLMGCSMEQAGTVPEHSSPSGLLYNHAYSIIDVQKVQGHRLLRIRNPWGEGEWKGKWGDGSKEWTPAMMKHFNYNFENDGTFFIEFEDFIKYFNHITVLRLLLDDRGEQWHKYVFQSKWTEANAGGCSNYETWTKNPQYAIIPTSTSSKGEEVKIFVELSQPDLRYLHKKKTSESGAQYKEIGLSIYSTDDATHKQTKAATEIASSPFVGTRDVSFEFATSRECMIMPCTFDPDVCLPFELAIYANRKIDIKELL